MKNLRSWVGLLFGAMGIIVIAGVLVYAIWEWLKSIMDKF